MRCVRKVREVWEIMKYVNEKCKIKGDMWEIWEKFEKCQKSDMCKKWSVCGVMWVDKVRGVWRYRGNVRCLEKCEKGDMCERRWEKCEKKCDM